MTRYACRYWRTDGERAHWHGFTVTAGTYEEAEAICADYGPTARVDGELVGTVRVADWLLRAMCRGAKGD